MALFIPHSIFHLVRLLYVRPETFGPYYIYVPNGLDQKLCALSLYLIAIPCMYTLSFILCRYLEQYDVNW